MSKLPTPLIVIMAAALGWVGPRCRCQQTSSGLTARDIFYRESKDDVRPPAVSSGKACAAKKGALHRTAAEVAGEKRASIVGVPGQANPASAIQKDPSGDEPEGTTPLISPVVQHLGLRYNLLRVDRRDNSILEAADPSRLFQEGDCLAFEFESNGSGYLYVLEVGSSGAWKPLFPSSNLPDESNLVRARAPLRVPANACFGIHPPQGVERVFVVLARNPAIISDLQESIRQDRGEAQLASLAQAVIQLKMQMESKLASRDLEVETVAQPQAVGEYPYSVYVANVSTMTSEQVSTEIEIRHN